MAVDNLVHVLIVLTGLSDQVVDCLACKQAFKTLEIIELLFAFLLYLGQES
jgi:hypothetical protein